MKAYLLLLTLLIFPFVSGIEKVDLNGTSYIIASTIPVIDIGNKSSITYNTNNYYNITGDSMNYTNLVLNNQSGLIQNGYYYVVLADDSQQTAIWTGYDDGVIYREGVIGSPYGAGYFGDSEGNVVILANGSSPITVNNKQVCLEDGTNCLPSGITSQTANKTYVINNATNGGMVAWIKDNYYSAINYLGLDVAGLFRWSNSSKSMTAELGSVEWSGRFTDGINTVTLANGSSPIVVNGKEVCLANGTNCLSSISSSTTLNVHSLEYNINANLTTWNNTAINFSMNANSIYDIDCMFNINTTLATTSLQTNISLPASTTFVNIAFFHPTTATNAVHASCYGNMASCVDGSTGGGLTIGLPYYIKGQIRTSATPGIFNMSIRSEIAGSYVTMQRGGYCEVVKV